MKKRDEMLSSWNKIRVAPQEHRAGVFGLGLSGRAMALHLKRLGYTVVGFDEKGSKFKEELEKENIQCALGDISEQALRDLDVLFLSPGVDPRKGVFADFVAQGKPICGELELFAANSKPTIAVTGTNGKSTTVALAAHLISELGYKGFAGGNYGQPLVDWLDDGAKDDVVVAELSSFQLETSYRFQPEVAVVLNVSPDHGDRYDTFADYVAAKRTLVENIGEADYAILNADCEQTRRMADVCPGHILWFGSDANSMPGPGFVTTDNRLLPVNGFDALPELEVSSASLKGEHNMQNAAAACLACSLMPLEVEDLSERLSKGLSSFSGLPHRMELLGEYAGVEYYNDSKATNDHAASVALKAMTRPTILLVGGVSKSGGYKHLREALDAKTRKVLAFGESRQEFADAFAGRADVKLCETLQEAVALAQEEACAGDAVLLAPACSSFDEFSNYVARGDFFREEVKKIAQERDKDE
ncbi:MAG: UDP-N-acetylmuramoyl-L-alanine--D-glutamate ligase [Myxococcales bacterium]|nr:UDP-N-acetylmuramoyl-L-alanine--D-glutamate ligase [Myxococcales bacterium]